MIAALTGELTKVEDQLLYLASGPVLYELLFPAADLPALQEMIGKPLTLSTIFYLAGDPSRGGLEPTLIGFLNPRDKKFFELFTTVKGIGPKKALRALSKPVAEIATAIEHKDSRYLIGLPEIGKRTAEQVIAELAGKVSAFIGVLPGARAAAGPLRRIDSVEEDAIVALISLGERRAEAEQLLQRVKAAHPDLKTSNDLLREMLRLRS